MPIFASIGALRRGLAAGDFSCQELARSLLAHIERCEPAINALISIDEKGALEQARLADEARAKGGADAPLLGIPLVHKDLFCTAGSATTCASRMLEQFVAPYDATVVSKLRRAGAVLLGKANMDEFAMGSSNETSYFGPVCNPWDTARVPGGSSGGSAAAVAAGYVPIATGTDTGGSIRQPAAFCGVTGIKPTYGRVSRYGMIAFASSLDQGGAFARNAEDAALLLAAMSGHDPRDSTSSTHSDDWLQDLAGGASLQPKTPSRVGIPAAFLQHSGVDPSTLEATREVFERAGSRCIDIDLPYGDAAVPAYYVLAGAEASTNLSRYDGVRFGYRCSDPTSLEDLYRRSRSEGFGTEVKRRILTGTYALSVGYYDAYYDKAQRLRRLIQQDFLSAFESVDLILLPSTPGPAFELGALRDDPVAMYQQDRFTVPASLAGLPALSMPAGSQGELPLGVQLVGPHFGERTLLEACAAFQRETDWHLRTPTLSNAS